MPQKKKTNNNGNNGGNKKPKKRSIFDMIRGIRHSRAVEKRTIHEQIHGIGRKSGRGGFSVAAYMSGGMIMPAHHAIGHKGPMRHG